WIYQSLLGIVQELIMNKYFGKILAKEMSERDAADRIKAAEIERRHQETERLKAEGATLANNNTSKKKIQARQKAEMDELKAAAIREEKAAKRARLGIVEEEGVPASQVGDRRYARGRAYVPDRFTNPSRAAEATEKAAAESEGYVAPEEETPETVEAPAAETVETVETPAAETAAVETAPAEAEEEAEEVFFVEEDTDETSN
ncbi:MAG: hypothetical protein IJY96_03725, partial [Oscillospiraceae bacterium]|nr:hypothetical protein [Oscillospiraceae bacterium]